MTSAIDHIEVKGIKPEDNWSKGYAPDFTISEVKSNIEWFAAGPPSEDAIFINDLNDLYKGINGISIYLTKNKADILFIDDVFTLLDDIKGFIKCLDSEYPDLQIEEMVLKRWQSK